MSGSEHRHGNPLGRLLGPTGFEVTCEQCFELLDRYVELDVAGADADEAIPGMRAHLEGCPACRDDYESLRALVGSAASARPHGMPRD